MIQWITVTVITLLIIFLFLSFKYWEKQHRLSFIPNGLPVSKILYAKQDSWGFGPGGNETGVIVYELPNSIAKEIQKSGLDYLTTLPIKPVESSVWRGKYEQWQNTPVILSKAWQGPRMGDTPDSNISKVEIENYLNRYGFGIAIDPIIESEINNAIAKSGSYYAYGRIGVLIMIPQAHKAVYAYNS